MAPLVPPPAVTARALSPSLFEGTLVALVALGPLGPLGPLMPLRWPFRCRVPGLLVGDSGHLRRFCGLRLLYFLALTAHKADKASLALPAKTLALRPFLAGFASSSASYSSSRIRHPRLESTKILPAV